MSKFRYVPIPNTHRTLFTRKMAFDEIDRTTEHANNILQLCQGKLSEADYEKLKRMLAGVDVDEDAPIKGVAMQPGGAMDSAAEASFYRQFPSAKRIGRDDNIGRYR